MPMQVLMTVMMAMIMGMMVMMMVVVFGHRITPRPDRLEWKPVCR